MLFSIRRRNTTKAKALHALILTTHKITVTIIQLAICFHAGILLGLLDPQDGGDIFLRNVD
jgi:hypothetical protein